MLYILNGPNSFLKESTISSITNKLSNDDYIIKKFDTSISTTNSSNQNILDDLLINLSVDGLFESLFCGVVILPETSKTKSKKKSNQSNLFLDLVKLAATYCSEAKQVILYTPTLLTNAQKKEINDICKAIHVEFIDLKYISSYKEISKFCSDILVERNIQFASSEDKDNFISYVCSFSECTVDKNGRLADLSLFTRSSDKVYNQHLIYSSLACFLMWSLDKTEPIYFEDCKRILLASQPKQNIYAIVEDIFKCSTKNELASKISESFIPLSKKEIFSVLTILNSYIWDYINFQNGQPQTRKCKTITNGNLIINNPLELYNKIYDLRNAEAMHDSSYKTDLILFFWEHLENN